VLLQQKSKHVVYSKFNLKFFITSFLISTSGAIIMVRKHRPHVSKKGFHFVICIKGSNYLNIVLILQNNVLVVAMITVLVAFQTSELLTFQALLDVSQPTRGSGKNDCIRLSTGKRL